MVAQTDLFSPDVLDPGGAAAVLPMDRKMICCAKCKLSKSRVNVVLGEGCMLTPPVMFVGEGPGAQEDAKGRPFVGPAGRLLDKMILAMGLTRESVYLTSVVACRPPQNRQPEPDEIIACTPFLLAHVAAIRPKVLVALGATAGRTLLHTRQGVADLRGRWHSLGQAKDGIPVRVTYHPAFLLRPDGVQCKTAAWKDLQEVMKLIGLKTEASAP